ncbi:MAG TPA: hypothetical protein VKU19_29570 [Bryobacteraceae bacterium]|nr:hypothetical protein [Bryobacteraceae bacterium]
MKKALHDQQRGININPVKQTVSDYLVEWVQATKADVAPATYVSYEATVRLHLIPGLGKIALAKLSASAIEQFKRAKLAAIRTNGPGVKAAVEGEPKPEDKHLSAASVRYCLTVLRMALDKAYRLDLVPRNVALLVDYPKMETAEITPYTPEQSKRFIEASKGHRLGALFSVALAIGLRKGEALGLQWAAIDFEQWDVGDPFSFATN